MVIAQTTPRDPSVAGIGYQIPDVPRTSAHPLNAGLVDPSTPGVPAMDTGCAPTVRLSTTNEARVGTMRERPGFYSRLGAEH